MNRNIFTTSFAIIFAILFGATPIFAFAQAADHVLDLTVEAKIAMDGTTQVTEDVLYDFGASEHHGIYRNLPTHVQEGADSRAFGITDITVTDKTGKVVPFEVLNQGTYMRIKIGDPDKLITGLQEYRIAYSAKSLIRAFPDNDIWEWDATSSNWPVTIRRARLSVVFPKEFAMGSIAKSCVTEVGGKPNTHETCQVGFLDKTASGTTRSIQFMDPELMQPKESMLVQLAFPKGTFKGITKATLPKAQTKSPHPLKIVFATIMLIALAQIARHIIARKYPRLVKG